MATSTTWYSDFGASNHITSELANLGIHEEYTRKDIIAVGNGAGLTISHIGSTKFSNNSSFFNFKNILHCLSIFANLLSVHQFVHDNNCFFFFFSDSFYSKDLQTGRTLFRGKSENGHYPMHFYHSLPRQTARHLLLLVFMSIFKSGILVLIIWPQLLFNVCLPIKIFPLVDLII